MVTDHCDPYPEYTEQPFSYLPTPGKPRKGTTAEHVTETLLVPSYLQHQYMWIHIQPRLDKYEICSKTANLLKTVALLHLWHMDFRLPPEQEYYLRV